MKVRRLGLEASAVDPETIVASRSLYWQRSLRKCFVVLLLSCPTMKFNYKTVVKKKKSKYSHCVGREGVINFCVNSEK